MTSLSTLISVYLNQTIGMTHQIKIKKMAMESLKISLFLLCLFFTVCTPNTDKNISEEKPNILLIFTDQQNINMMSAMGNSYLKTPNMDKLAGEGIMFTKSYCTSPVCGPARSSIISGRMPHETGVEWNGDAMNAEVINAGEIFRDAGYHTVWAGKWHLPESYPQRAVSKQKEIRGFDLLPFRNPEIKNWMLGSETDPDLTEAVVDFIDRYDAKAPFFLAVSYHNPHDICFYPRKAGWVSENDSLLDIRHYGFEYRLPDPVAIHPDHFPNLPPLPANHEISKDEPAFIADKRTDHNEYGLETKLANQEFSEKEWRGYYHAYCRLTEMVDVEIGKVMTALAKHGYEENTIVVFTSDHGDGAAAHKWAAKLSLYEESSKIPLILSWPGQITAGLVDQKHLVSQIDILPTLCDYAGIDASVSFTGESLRAIVENPAADWREYLVVELADYKPDSSRKGRMLRSSQYKYNVYSSGTDNEQLFNLQNDPGEMNNLAGDPAHQNIKSEHLQQLQQWMEDTGDTFEVLK